MQQLSFTINQDIAQQGIKKCFEMGGSLTVQEAFSRFSTTELRKIVCRLKSDHNMKIASEWVGNGRDRFKRYFLEKEEEN